MKSRIIPIIPNYSHTSNKRLFLRKLYISNTRPAFNSDINPFDFEIFVQNLSLSSDRMPSVLPAYEKDLRFPIPILLDRGAPIKFKVADDIFEYAKERNFILEAEKSLIPLNYASIPYFLVWRFETNADTNIVELDKTLRVPTGRYFIPFFSWGIKLRKYKNPSEEIVWITDQFDDNDKIQIIDLSSESIGEGFFAADYIFGNQRYHFFPNSEAWNWEVRLQGEINQTIEENRKYVYYFIICGILSVKEEYERWSNRRAFESIQRL